MNPELKLQAAKLRRSGYLYSEIAKELNIAKSTAYDWTHELELNKNQIEEISKKLKLVQSKKIKKLAIINRQKREGRDLLIQNEATKTINAIVLSTNHKKLICSILFWCEGGKMVSNGVRFINSDPAMIKTFLFLLRESFQLNEAKFRALVHLHDYHDQEKQLAYWSKLTNIPLNQFNKPYLKPHTGKNTRDNYPGCISIRYNDHTIGKLLKMIYIEFAENL